MPRVTRAETHARAARWIDSLAGGRGADLAEARAHHYLSAMELFQAAGVDPSDLVGATIDALLAAAQQSPAAVRVHSGGALRVARTRPRRGRRPPTSQLLFALASAQGDLAQADAFSATAAQAAAGFIADGDLESAARVEILTASESVEARPQGRGRRGGRAGAGAGSRPTGLADYGSGPRRTRAPPHAGVPLRRGDRPSDVGAGRGTAVQRPTQRGQLAHHSRNGTGPKPVPRDLRRRGRCRDRRPPQPPTRVHRGHNNIAELLLEDGDIEGAATRGAGAEERRAPPASCRSWCGSCLKSQRWGTTAGTGRRRTSRCGAIATFARPRPRTTPRARRRRLARRSRSVAAKLKPTPSGSTPWRSAGR